MGRKACEFALYKGEEILAMGTIKEIAAEVGVKPSSVRFYKSPTYSKRCPKGKGKALVRLEDDE